MFRCFGLFSLTCCLAHALLQILLRNLYPQLPDTDGLGLGVQFTEINSREDDPKPIFKGNFNIKSFIFCFVAPSRGKVQDNHLRIRL